ncbi:BnaC06g24950D [Brassica napus]|uniref:BnaC06g24950D protein n=1 Tax=Brassica napus TaxID=3708 RepID=A0A078GDX0_BRANA|nr:BnaC06g24950D [Brassica napus]
MVLNDWVLECWENGDIMQVLDHKIGHEYIEKQVALVLKLGLLCSHPVAAMRPSISITPLTFTESFLSRGR